MIRGQVAAVLLCAALPLRVAGAADAPAALKFRWGPDLACIVEQKQTADGQQVVTSRFNLGVVATSDGLGIRLWSFKTIHMSLGNTPARRQMEEDIWRPSIEREFFVDSAGGFLRAESVEKVRQRLEAARSKNKSGVSLLALAATRDPQGLHDKYRAEWRTFIGGWIGLIPGKTQNVELAPGEMAKVTVSAPRACTDVEAIRCVEVVAVTTPPPFGPWKRYTLEAEPGSLTPHLWFEEDLMRDETAAAKERAYNQRLLMFTCPPS